MPLGMLAPTAWGVKLLDLVTLSPKGFTICSSHKEVVEGAVVEYDVGGYLTGTNYEVHGVNAVRFGVELYDHPAEIAGLGRL